MFNGKTFLAIIPARGGSKRLPKKNILNLAGKPMISWTIDAALKSKYIDRVIVSTDDKEIASISTKYGASVPFMRPNDISTDFSTSIEVVLHTVKKLHKMNEYYDYVVLLQPTSPLRTAQNIDESVELMQLKNSNAVISVCKSEHSPLWCNKIPKNGNLSNFLDDSILNIRSQDLDNFYCLNGAIYLCDTSILIKEKTFFLKKNIFAYKMSREQSIDVDESIDLKLSELYLSSYKP